jgi:hypothetical protein
MKFFKKSEVPVDLWNSWMSIVTLLAPACRRRRTFLWFVSILAAFSIRTDIAGASSFMRVLGLVDYCYDRILDFFNSGSLLVEKLTHLWIGIVFQKFNLVRINGRVLIPADGIKVPKTGKKMPAVKRLHQESNNNNKPEYIFGHSIQAAGVLANGLNSVFCVPLMARIHEGLMLCKKDKSTSLDRLIQMLDGLPIPEPYYLVADAYYSCAPIIKGLLKSGNHLISRVRTNAVAYGLPPKTRKKHKRGPNKKFGRKVKLANIFKKTKLFKKIKCIFYGIKNVSIQIASMDLVMRRTGILARYVFVRHPDRGDIIFITTDLSLLPEQVLEAYMLRFKIEVSFKQAIHTVGSYLYHFWSKRMKPFKRKSGNQDISNETEKYKVKILRKTETYHRYIQMGIIAQGLLQYLSCMFSKKIWEKSSTFIRTRRTEKSASEAVVRDYLREVFPEFIADSIKNRELTRFIRTRMQPKRRRLMDLTA